MDNCKSFLPPSFNPIKFKYSIQLYTLSWEGRKEKHEQGGKQLSNYLRYTVALTRGIKELAGKQGVVGKKRYKYTQGSQEKIL